MLQGLSEMVVESVRVHMLSSQHVVILKESERERYLPIWIGPWEANAIALAIRAGVPIYATEQVLDRAGVVPETDEDEKLSVFREFVNSLEVDLEPGGGGGSLGGGSDPEGGSDNRPD